MGRREWVICCLMSVPSHLLGPKWLVGAHCTMQYWTIGQCIQLHAYGCPGVDITTCMAMGG